MDQYTQFMLPFHWAPYFLYGEASGYTEDELNEMDEWDILHAPGPCVDVGEGEFTAWGHDGWLGAERADFTFQVIEPVYVDGQPAGEAFGSRGWA